MTPHEIWPKIKMSELAIALNMSRAGVYRWKENSRIPAERVVEVSELTGIPREALRPDLYSLAAEAEG
jgi:DNA-binding transcriptional regulator YdaS (Cro superfamily)